MIAPLEWRAPSEDHERAWRPAVRQELDIFLHAPCDALREKRITSGIREDFDVHG